LILKLYQHPAESEKKARALQQYVKQRLTWRAVAADILALLEKTWKPRTAA
jgi:hypothetical protein